MADIKIEDISSVKKKLSITIPVDEVTKVTDEKFTEIGKDARIEGFRKGKVPENILRQKFAKEVRGEVVNALVQSSYEDALKSNDLYPVGQPEVDLKEFTDGEPLTFTATVEIKPKVEVSGYKELSLKAQSTDPTDDDIKEALEHMQKTHSELKEVDRAAKNGDTVILDFDGYIDGEPLEGGKADNFTLELGSSSFIPGFEEDLVGLKKGDEKELNLKFPDEYQAKEIAGKPVLFKVKIHEVKEKILPKLDDEFAKDVEADSLDDLKEKMAKEIKSGKKRGEMSRLRKESIDKLIESNEFEVPDSMVQGYLQQIIQQVIQNSQYGMGNPEDAGLSADELQAKYRIVATRECKANIIIESIVKQEKVDVPEEEVTKALTEAATSQGKTLEQFRGELEKQGYMDYFVDGLVKDKVFDMILPSLD